MHENHHKETSTNFTHYVKKDDLSLWHQNIWATHSQHLQVYEANPLDGLFIVIFQVFNIQILKQFGAERLLEIMSEVPENLK